MKGLQLPDLRARRGRRDTPSFGEMVPWADTRDNSLTTPPLSTGISVWHSAVQSRYVTIRSNTKHLARFQGAQSGRSA